MSYATVTMKPKLNPARLYYGDNGRITCGSLRCAGMSAYSGLAMSGHRMKAVGAADRQAYAEAGLTCKCEACGATGLPEPTIPRSKKRGH